MKTRILLIIILSVTSLYGMAQNLDKMPVQKRDSFLIKTAKDAVKKYAPGYYREYKKPIIERLVIDDESVVDAILGTRMGRPYYRVTFPYDENKEHFEHGFSAFVQFWADNGTLQGIMPGNGVGRLFKEARTRAEEEEVEIIPYVKREKPGPYDFMKKRN